MFCSASPLHLTPEERSRRKAALTREQLLIDRCERLAYQGRLSFSGPGEIRLGRRFLRGRFGSLFFRCAVEALTRQHSGIIWCRVTRAGKPYDVILACPNCRRNARRWSWHHQEPFPRFDLEEWPFSGDRTKAYGHCSGCRASATLRREYDGTWAASVSRLSDEES